MSELVNPGNTPQVYTKDGKTIGAGERLEVDKLDTVAKAAVSAGRLVFEEDDEKDDAGPKAAEPPESASASKPETSGSKDAESATVTARRSPGARK